MLSNIFVIVCGHLKWKQSCLVFFIVCIKQYMYCRSRSNHREGEEWIPLIGLTPPHLCVCIEAKIWICNVICRRFLLLYSVSDGESSLVVLLILLGCFSINGQQNHSCIMQVQITHVAFYP